MGTMTVDSGISVDNTDPDVQEQKTPLQNTRSRLKGTVQVAEFVIGDCFLRWISRYKRGDNNPEVTSIPNAPSFITGMIDSWRNYHHHRSAYHDEYCKSPGKKVQIIVLDKTVRTR